MPERAFEAGQPSAKSPRATAVLALWNDVDPALEAAYEAWHAHEHVPERCRVPGILWGRRWRREAGVARPAYLTLYGLSSPAVLESAPYQQLLREPTPMSRAMRPTLRNLSRWVCRMVVDELPPEAAWMALQVWTDETVRLPGPVVPHEGAMSESPGLLAERLPEAAPLPWLVQGQGQTVAGRHLRCTVVSQAAWQADPDWARTATLYTALPVGAFIRRP